MSKKFSTLSIALLVLAGSFVGISSASAASPYKACSPANAKTKIGSLSYTCAKNPAGTTTKLVWVSKQCLDANASYLSAKSLSAAVGSSFESRISSANRLKATNERLLLAAQKNVDNWTKTVAKYANLKVSGTAAEKAQIATLEAGIERNKQRVIESQALIANNEAQIKEATDGAAKTANDLVSAKASIATACK